MWSTLLSAAIGAFLANLIAEFITSLSRSSQLQEHHRDSDLAELIRMSQELQDLAELYWTKGPKELGSEEEILNAKIVARQHHVLTLVASLLKGNLPLKYECDVQFTNVMDAISGGFFGSPDAGPAPERLQAIYESVLGFNHIAKTCRRKLKRGWLA